MDPEWIDSGDIDLVHNWDRGEDLADGVTYFTGDFLAFTKGKYRWSSAGDGESKGSCGDGGVLRFIKIWDEFLAAWLSDDVVDRA